MNTENNDLPESGQYFVLPSGNVVRAFGNITEAEVPCEYIGGMSGGMVFTAEFLRKYGK